MSIDLEFRKLRGSITYVRRSHDLSKRLFRQAQNAADAGNVRQAERLVHFANMTYYRRQDYPGRQNSGY